jgi:hypothetical protein
LELGGGTFGGMGNWQLQFLVGLLALGATCWYGTRESRRIRSHLKTGGELLAKYDYIIGKYQLFFVG